jgi:hypothetical protein
MVMEDEVRVVAHAFADALDRNDFDKVATLLVPTCRYDRTTASFTSEVTLVGPDAILESYRWHDVRARSLFDRVDYSSVVEAVEGLTAVIRFTDVLEKAGQRHTYSCRQRITVNESSLIDSIVHEDISGETMAARAFMQRVGVTL